MKLQQQRITLTLKLVRERFYPNLSKILLILLICRKLTKVSICSVINKVTETNLEVFLNIRK